MASTLGQVNPLRYRGYVYDTETGLYYLQSRYYNPEIGRFINADAFVSTGQGILGNNMFAYCNNNPAVRKDDDGESWLAVVAGAVVNVATTYIAAKITGQEYTWLDAGVAAFSGAVNSLGGLWTLLSGASTGVYAGYMAYKNGADLGESLLCGGVAAFTTTMSIGNLANFQGSALDLVTNTAVDLVFGTGGNSIAAAAYKVVTNNAQKRNTRNTQTGNPGSTYSVISQYKQNYMRQLLLSKIPSTNEYSELSYRGD